MTQIAKNFFYNKEKHHFHLVENSQLPFVTSTTIMLLVTSFVLYFHPFVRNLMHGYDNTLFQWSWFGFSIGLFVWFLIVLVEAGQGHHTWVVRNGLRFGMVLFIVSEVMFFFAFFWAFFHVSLAPAVSTGAVWPPKSIQSLEVWGLPLVNTLLLLTSGITITFAHHAQLKATASYWYDFLSKHLASTVTFGAIFLFCQWLEYKYGIFFRWKESVYGSTFFVTTGFHGLHVSIGAIFLLFCLIRNLLTAPSLTVSPETIKLILDWISKHYIYYFPQANRNWVKKVEHAWVQWFASKVITKKPGVKSDPNLREKLTLRKNQHLAFEASAWYWHFVDVVWIFLFITVYWWGN